MYSRLRDRAPSAALAVNNDPGHRRRRDSELAASRRYLSPFSQLGCNTCVRASSAKRLAPTVTLLVCRSLVLVPAAQVAQSADLPARANEIKNHCGGTDGP